MSNLKTHAMLVNLSVSQWTARKYDKGISKKIEAEYNAYDAGRYNKVLIANDKLDEIQKISGEIRTFHYINTLPWSDSGMRIIPVENYFDYVGKVGDLSRRFIEAINKFIEVYPELKEEAKIRLNGMFSEFDYPPINSLKSKFNISVDFTPMPDASDFRINLADAELNEIKNDLENRLRDNEKIAMTDLWKRAYSVVEHMVGKLKDDKGKFHDTLVENIAELCQLLPKLNFAKDADLDRMGKEMESRLTFHEAEDLRKDLAVRQEVCESAEDILNKMKGFI